MEKISMQSTLSSLLSDQRIACIAKDAIRGMDLAKDPKWNKTLEEIKKEDFACDLQEGFTRLFSAFDGGNAFFPLYTEDEVKQHGDGQNAHLVFFASADKGAKDRPFILLVPGGGFVNVWNLTEGWPVAAAFNRLGYHVFILTYRVGGNVPPVNREMDDFARALEVIGRNAEGLGVNAGRYITCGFSAGGYLVCLWNTPLHGFKAYGLPAPGGCIPIYPLTSWKLGREEPDYIDFSVQAIGKDADIATYEVPDNASLFPPTYIAVSENDELVDPDNSRLLISALKAQGIPCFLDIREGGWHGFADGEGMNQAGWTGRAVAWLEKQK